MSDTPRSWQEEFNELFDPNDVPRWLTRDPDDFIEIFAHEFLEQALKIRGWVELLQQDEAIANIEFKGLRDSPLSAEDHIPLKVIFAWLISDANNIQRLTRTSVAYVHERAKNAADTQPDSQPQSS